MDKFSAGKTYKNKHMRDVIFHVTKADDIKIKGYWLNERTKNMLTEDVDHIDICRLKKEDWSEVDG